MSNAAATVLSFRYQTPKPCCPVNPKAAKPVQEAQAAIDVGLRAAETEFRAAGYDVFTAQHLARMAVLMFLDAFEGEDITTGTALYAMRDRLTREEWTRRLR